MCVNREKSEDLVPGHSGQADEERPAKGPEREQPGVNRRRAGRGGILESKRTGSRRRELLGSKAANRTGTKRIKN